MQPIQRALIAESEQKLQQILDVVVERKKKVLKLIRRSRA